MIVIILAFNSIYHILSLKLSQDITINNNLYTIGILIEIFFIFYKIIP